MSLFNLKNLKKYIGIFLFILVACEGQPNYQCIKVKEVIDGDTIRLANGELVRYIGIDTPELREYKKGVWVYKPEAFALQAKERNEQLVKNKYVRLEFDIEKKDRFGRLLAYCFVKKDKQEIFVNALLLREGLARLCYYPPNTKYLELFSQLQEEARKKKVGLWQRKGGFY